MKILSVEGLTMRFGGLAALSDVSFDLNNNEILGLIGPNGAGKTTFFNCLTGITRPTEGKIMFNGHSLEKRKPNYITGTGICRTFQTIRLFNKLTCLENVLIGTHRWAGLSIAEPFHKLFHKKALGGAAYDKAFEELDFMGLLGKKDEIAGTLSYGDQRRLEIARALASKPSLLLLDEPAAGMNPTETMSLKNTIEEINRRGIDIVLIEHHMKLVMSVSKRVVVLNYGRKIGDGTPEEIQNNADVITAYLGENRDEHA